MQVENPTRDVNKSTDDTAVRLDAADPTPGETAVRLDAADPTPGETVDRLDAIQPFEIRADQITPTGGLRLNGQITRSGIFEYRCDGKIVREYRPAEEVFAPASVATLGAAVITIGHRRLVNAATWRQDAVGHMSDTSTRNGSWLHSQLCIQDKSAVEGVQGLKLTGLSAGYRCRLDHTPGTTPSGEPYDLVQRDIRYNHVALIPPGTGRAGAEARVRFDGAGDDVRFDSDGLYPSERIPNAGTNVDFEKLYRELQARFDAQTSDIGRVSGERDAARADLAKVAGERDAARADLATARLDSSDAAIDARVQSRAALVTSVTGIVAKDYRFDGKSDNDVRLDALKTMDPTFDATGKDATYVKAYFDGRLSARGATAVAGARVAATTAPTNTAPTLDPRFDDGTEMPDLDAISKRRENVNANGWRTSFKSL